MARKIETIRQKYTQSRCFGEEVTGTIHTKGRVIQNSIRYTRTTTQIQYWLKDDDVQLRKIKEQLIKYHHHPFTLSKT